MNDNEYNFPIKILEFDKIDYEKYPCYNEKVYGSSRNENAIAIIFEENGYNINHFENEIVCHLFGYICYKELIRKPDWNKWNSNKMITDYPELYQHLSLPEKEWIENLNINLGWAFSDDCLRVNGQPALLGVGIPYQMCKNEINKFIYEDLPDINLTRLMNENWKILYNAREEYPTLFNWASYYHPTILKGLIERMPLAALQFILHKMFLNFYYYRTGFPDFWAWKAEEENIKLIEVKGIRERIGKDQIWWLEKLNELEIHASVIRVKWISKK